MSSPPPPATEASSLVYQAPTSAARIGPTSYAFSPLPRRSTRLVRTSSMHGSGSVRHGCGSATRLQGVGLEVKALRALAKRLEATLGGYALDDEAAISALSGDLPRIPAAEEGTRRKRAAAAGALILSERTTLRFYARIVGLCLDVLSPSGVA